MKILFKAPILAIGIVVPLFNFGCAFQKPSNMAPLDPTVVGTSSSSTDYHPEQWDESLLSRGNAKIQVKSLKGQFRSELKQRFQVPQLLEVKSEFSGAFTLYRIPNMEQAANIIFIQPKLFVFGTAQGGNVLNISSPDQQRVTLTIPMSYVDGLRSSLTSYEGQESIELPPSLVIPNTEALKAELSRKFGTEINLQALPSCPTELSLIHIKGSRNERFRLVPTVPIQTRCPINEFFTASMTSSREEATSLIENALDTGLSVQIFSQFRVEYRNPVAVYALNLNSIGMYQKIREQFVATPFGSGIEPSLYLARQLISPLQRLLSDEIGQTGANPAWVPYSRGIRALEDMYFDDVTGQVGCPSAQRCYRVKKEIDVNFNGPIELMWIEEDTLGASDLISTVTLVKGLDAAYPIVASNQRVLPMTAVIPTPEACLREAGNIPGCSGFSCERFKGNAYCRKGNTKAPINQFQVFPGAKLKVSLNRVTEWRYELPVPRDETPLEQKSGVLKCANAQEIPGACAEYKTFCPKELISFCSQPKDECDNRKKVYQDHCSEEVTYDTSCGFLGWGRCTEKVKEKRNSCQKIEIGEYCSSYKTTCEVPLTKVCPVEQITECVTPAKQCEQYTTEFYSKYTYSEPWVTPKHLDLSKGESPEQLWEGIDIEFSSFKEDGSGYDRVVCPALAFPHQLDGHHSNTLTLENQENAFCQPFNDWNQKTGRWPSIALINHISFTRPYQCGSLEWTHSVDSGSSHFTRDTLSYSCPATGELKSQPVSAQYEPLVDIEGTVSLLGRSMDTVSSTQARNP